MAAATRIPEAPQTEGMSSGSESNSSSSVTRSPSRTDDVEDGGDEPVASTSSAILSYTVVDESVPDRVVPGTSTSSVGGGAEPSADSPLQGVNVDDVELSEIMRHLESPNPDNSASASVYSPTGGEGNHVPKVRVDLPPPTSLVEEETLPSGLSREGITEWVRLRHIDLAIKKLRCQIRLAELLEEKYSLIYEISIIYTLFLLYFLILLLFFLHIFF